MPGRPLPKLSTKKPYSDIRKWIYETNKKYVPNPMKPLEFKTTKEKISDFNKLGKILKETHSPGGRINKLIEEVNDLIKRVTVNETDIAIHQKRLDKSDNIQKVKSKKGHTHQFAGTGAVLPSTSKKGGPIKRRKNSSLSKLKKGGSIKKLQPGGKFTRPVTTDKNVTRGKLIDEIKRLQNQNSG